jgi:uncharacterized membrane protein
LYQYGVKDHIKKHVKFIVIAFCISIAYFVLALTRITQLVGVVVVVTLVVVVLVVYSTYQVIGLYYSMIFKD